MFTRRMKRALAWLLMTLMVLGAIAGCGSQAASPQSQPPAARQSQGVSADQDKALAAGVSGEDNTAQKEAEAPAEEADVSSMDIPAEEAGAPSMDIPAQEADAPSTDAPAQEAGVPSTDIPAEEAGAPSADAPLEESDALSADAPAEESDVLSADAPSITEDGSYTTKDEVALYLHTYGRLPGNYITKKEAENLGWDSKKGNLWDVAPGKSIGGSHFGNYEKQLPEKKGRKYYECDINYEGKYRGAERIIYSDDGLVFYTGDHYKTFEQLYPQESNTPQ